MKNTTMETYTGRKVDLARPDPKQICIEDIAWHLSRQPRYLGATSSGSVYSVAQHSVLVLNRVRATVKNADIFLLITSLLHDAHEAYMGDITRPMKQLLDLTQPLKRLETRLQHAVYKGLFSGVSINGQSFEEDTSGEVDRADDWACRYEAYHLLHSKGDWFDDNVAGSEFLEEEFIVRTVTVKTEKQAYESFLGHYRDLTS